MELYRKGLKVGELIKILKKYPQDLPFFVACDEEQNTLFRGWYLETSPKYVVIAGLSGLGVSDEERDKWFKEWEQQINKEEEEAKCQSVKDANGH
jgi:hypothetical protein